MMPNESLQRTPDKRGLILAVVISRAADLRRYAHHKLNKKESGTMEKNKIYIITIGIFLCVCISGCANVVTVKETYTSSGQKGYVIDCSGDSDYHLIMHNPTLADCYIKAGEICGDRGYEILELSGEQGAQSMGVVSATKNQGQGAAFGITKHFRNMLIKCNSKD